MGYSDGFGSNVFDLGRVGSIFCGLGRVRNLWFRFEFGKFLLKISIFSPWVKKSLWVGSKSTWDKGKSASYLLQVKSNLGLGRVRVHL